MAHPCTRPHWAAFLLSAFFLSAPLAAQVVRVDDGNQTPTQDGSAQYPYRTIQGAILAAQPGDTIQVATGTYGNFGNGGASYVVRGGYAGGTSASYATGSGGDFGTITADPALTVVSGGQDSIGVNLTRFDFEPFSFSLLNLTVRDNRKGIVFDQEVSWPHVANVTIADCIVENNGTAGETSLGAGILLSGQGHRLLNNIIRDNRGGRGPAICGNLDVGDSVLVEGNLVENNAGYDDHCGGIYLGGYAELRNNTIRGNQLLNSYGWGGGVLILGTAHMSGNIISGNYCPSYGGAVFVDEGGVLYMRNDLIYGNSTALMGAGIAADYGDPGSSYVTITNCTIANNHSPDGGNAVLVDGESFATVTNSILYGNGDDFLITPGSTIDVSWTLCEENIPGTGNFNADPLFADTTAGDYHVRSTAGRYDPVLQGWVTDAQQSPAIDAGDPASSYANEPAPNGGRINLGAYGNTPEASLSSPQGLGNTPINGSGITVYPVPARDQLTVELAGPSGAVNTVHLYNTAGERVMEQRAGHTTKLTDLSRLSAGVYHVRVITADGSVFTRPVVIAD